MSKRECSCFLIINWYAGCQLGWYFFAPTTTLTFFPGVIHQFNRLPTDLFFVARPNYYVVTTNHHHRPSPAALLIPTRHFIPKLWHSLLMIKVMKNLSKQSLYAFKKVLVFNSCRRLIRHFEGPIN